MDIVIVLIGFSLFLLAPVIPAALAATLELLQWYGNIFFNIRLRLAYRAAKRQGLEVELWFLSEIKRAYNGEDPLNAGFEQPGAEETDPVSYEERVQLLTIVFAELRERDKWLKLVQCPFCYGFYINSAFILAGWVAYSIHFLALGWAIGLALPLIILAYAFFCIWLGLFLKLT